MIEQEDRPWPLWAVREHQLSILAIWSPGGPLDSPEAMSLVESWRHELRSPGDKDRT
jgi:hypothetical protein